MSAGQRVDRPTSDSPARRGPVPSPSGSGWRAALRIARRDALRARGRSLLVVAMIALPVVGMTAADVTIRSAKGDQASHLTRTLGAADAHYFASGLGGPVEQSPDMSGLRSASDGDGSGGTQGHPIDVPAALPPGVRHLISEQTVPAMVRTRYGLERLPVTELKVSDPLVRGRVNLVRGRYPANGREVLASPAFLTASGLRVGSWTRVQGLDTRFTIVGAAEEPDMLGEQTVFALPGSVIAPWKAEAVRRRATLPAPDGKEWYVTVAGGVTWKDVLAANARGVAVESRQVELDPPPRAQVPYYRHADSDSGGSDSTQLTAFALTVAVLGMLEITLLAGPAFAVGARRARRNLGLIGANGGDRRHIRAVVLAGGLVLGAAGAAGGVAGGLALTALFRPSIEQLIGVRFAGMLLRPLELLVIAGLGLVTGVVAAFAPAQIAARQSVLESLGGRRGVRGSSPRVLVAGLLGLALGVAVALYGAVSGNGRICVAAGSAIAELGALACVPALLGVFGRLGRVLPLSPRLALRDAVRNRGRTAPAVAAVMAAVAGTVAVLVYSASTTAQSAYRYEPQLRPGTVALSLQPDNLFKEQAAELPRLRRDVERTLPVTGRADVRRVWAGSDCYTDQASPCGSIEIDKPKDHRCPLSGPDGRRLAAHLSPDEHKRMMESPACVDASQSWSEATYSDAGIVVGDASLLRVYFGLDDPAAERALAQGTPVLADSAYAEHGRATLRIFRNADDDHGNGTGGRAVTLPVVTLPDSYAATPAVGMIMPQRTADRLGLHTAEEGSFYRVSRAPTSAEEQRVTADLDRLGGSATLTVERGYQSHQGVVLLTLTLFAALVTVGAAAIATGLSQADAEADLATLAAVGAPPRVRRTLSGMQCAVVAGIGVLVGTAAGVVPAVALRLVDLQEALRSAASDPTLSTYTPIVLPWPALLAIALAIPLFAGALAAAFTRSRPVLVRRAA